jgi:uncharacterized protein with von Willebrand factor type A (vWA) domain
MSENILNALYIKARTTAGLCTPNVEQLRNYLEKSREYTERAKQTTGFVSMSPELPGQLTKASDAIGEVLKGIEKVDKHLGDIGAACQISDAVKVLNKWAADPNPDNAEAAAAFDKLFGGISVYVEKLPPPIGQFSAIFKQISIGKFFTGMERLMFRTGKGEPYTPTAKALRAIENEDNQTFRPNKMP